MIELVIPSLEDLWFRESLMADEETMSYNAAWGGTIPFPKEKWESWYEVWVRNPGKEHFYRYLKDAEKGFVGEAAWHFDSRRNLYICDVIVLAKHRNQGFGSEGINLLCKAAKENGISALYDDIAADNPSWKLFLKNGFEDRLPGCGCGHGKTGTVTENNGIPVHSEKKKQKAGRL